MLDLFKLPLILARRFALNFFNTSNYKKKTRTRVSAVRHAKVGLESDSDKSWRQNSCLINNWHTFAFIFINIRNEKSFKTIESDYKK